MNGRTRSLVRRGNGLLAGAAPGPMAAFAIALAPMAAFAHQSLALLDQDRMIELSGEARSGVARNGANEFACDSQSAYDRAKFTLYQLGAVVLGAVWLATAAHAHHAASGIYDRNDIGAIEGEVVSISWRNPHVRFEVVRAGESGAEESWEIEFGSVNNLGRLGVTRDLIAVGDDRGGSISLCDGNAPAWSSSTR